MNVHILQIVERGLVADTIPMVSNDLDLVKIQFMEHVRLKGFRAPRVFETWEDYFEAFGIWEDSDHCPYDKDDWQIILWQDIGVMEGPF